MARLLYIGLLGLLLVSCINMNDPEEQAFYIEEREKFDKALVKLFPDRLPNNMLSFGFAQPHDYVAGKLYLTVNFFSKEEYIQEKTKFSNQSKHHVSSNSNCFFIVDDYEDIKQGKCDDFYPIPRNAIYDTDDYEKKKERITDSEVFFIDFKSGDFLKDGKNHSPVDLPTNWVHGYSTGITANDNTRTIKFWLVVW